MKLTVLELVSNVELNDFKVKNVFLDIAKKEFQLRLEGCYWFKDAISKSIAMENGGIIKINNYTSFEARYFVNQDKLWRTLDYNNLEIMDEVNRMTYQNSILTLAGNGRKFHHWLEFIIDEGQYEIEFK